MPSKKTIECMWLSVVLFVGIGSVLLFSTNPNNLSTKNGKIINSTVDFINNLYNGDILIYYNNNFCTINVIQSDNITYINNFLDNNYPINTNIIIYVKNHICYLNNLYTPNFILLYSGISFFAIGFILFTYLCFKKNHDVYTINNTLK